MKNVRLWLILLCTCKLLKYSMFWCCFVWVPDSNEVKYLSVICCVHVSADSYLSVHTHHSLEGHELLRIVGQKMDRAEEDMVLAVASHTGGTHRLTKKCMNMFRSVRSALAWQELYLSITSWLPRGYFSSSSSTSVYFLNDRPSFQLFIWTISTIIKLLNYSFISF